MKNIIELHMVRTCPANSMNRNRTGDQKTTTYGGVTRQVISSQAKKRAVRNSWEGNSQMKSYNSRKIKDKIKSLLEEQSNISCEGVDFDEVAGFICNVRFNDLKGFDEQKTEDAPEKEGKKTSKKKTAIANVSQMELDYIVNETTELLNGMEKYSKKDLLENSKDYCKKLKSEKILSWDTALFGRMMASNKHLDVPAACQVAFSISIDKSDVEYDDFIATDDFVGSFGVEGSAHMGESSLMSSSLYEFAVFNSGIAKDNMPSAKEEDIADKIVEAIKAFVFSMPSGKQNSFAAYSWPHVMVVVKDAHPLSLMDTFHKPFDFSKSENTLQKAWSNLKDNFETKHKKWAVKAQSFELTNDSDDDLETLLSEVKKAILI